MNLLVQVQIRVERIRAVTAIILDCSNLRTPPDLAPPFFDSCQYQIVNFEFILC
jgi:hypothetical protein